MENDKIKILIIEDNAGDLRLITEFLSEASVRGRKFEITGAGSLFSARKLLEANRYDIVLLDLFLPDSSGLDTFSAVCCGAPDTPIVPLTGLEDESVALEAVRMGAQDYLVKKTVNDELLSRVISYSIERKKIYTSLRASEENYRTLIDALNDAIAVFDHECRVVMSNNTYKAAAGSAERDRPDHFNDYAAAIPDLPSKTMEICRRALSEGKLITFEGPCQWKGAQGFLEITGIPMPLGAKAQRVIVVAKDITGRKRIEQLKDNFASLVSHELRAPLTAVLAGLGIVLDSGDGRMEENEKKLLYIAYCEAQRLDRIISKILEMSRLEAGASKFKKTMLDFVRIAEEAISRFSAQAKSRNIELIGNYSADKIMAFADSDGITEVFTNLLSNALKFTEKGSIEVGISEKEGSLECYVKDSGIGISRENQPKLFSKFRQFGKPVVESEKGAGLGLFIVKEILRRHNGTLSVSSEPGKGTTFSFTLPKRRAEKMAEMR